MANVLLTWNGVQGTGISYNVYRGTSSGGEVKIASGLTSNGYTDTGTPTGTLFYYVTAVQGGAESQPSNEVSVQIPTAPPAPTGLTAIITA